ncbi:hypothetical protein TNCV_482861 [Trichonephila clavipes]|uniref:Uncharacterized protein n=1 Tax=Trichonephila clavipes TaxID=2585209 RepID=A0A8X6SCQ1_TRICX|nr:hypothetical protein TNCV_482861 [Trichonephila clavipes]
MGLGSASGPWAQTKDRKSVIACLNTLLFLSLHVFSTASWAIEFFRYSFPTAWFLSLTTYHITTSVNQKNSPSHHVRATKLGSHINLSNMRTMIASPSKFSIANFVRLFAL